MASEKFVFVPFGTFKKENCIVKDVVVSKVSIGKEARILTKSPLLYRQGKEVGVPYFEFLGRNAYINPQFEYGNSFTEEQKKDLEFIKKNMTSISLMYEMTSKETVHNPTEEEQYVKYIIDSLIELATETLIAEAEKPEKPENPKKGKDLNPADYCQLQDKTMGMYTLLTKKKKPIIKPIYMPGRSQDTGKEDPNAPMVCFVPFVAKRLKDGRFVVDTKVWGPGDKDLIPANIVRKSGFVEPVMVCKEFSWATQSDFPGIVKLEVAQMNFTPIVSASKLTEKRLTKRNNAKEEDDAGGEGSDEVAESNSVQSENNEQNDEEDEQQEMEKAKEKAKSRATDRRRRRQKPSDDE